MTSISWKDRIALLDESLTDLKRKDNAERTKIIVDNFYDLKFDIDDLTEFELIFVHVKLHTSWGYKKPFISRNKIKEIHDLVVRRLEHHFYYDSLDN